MSLLGGSLLGQKRFAEAEPLLVQGYEGMKQREAAIPAGCPRLREATERLVQLDEAKNQPENAAEWRAKRALAVESLEGRDVPSALAVADVSVREGPTSTGVLDPAGAVSVGINCLRDMAFNSYPNSGECDSG